MSIDLLDSEELDDLNESRVLLICSIKVFKIFNYCSLKSKFSQSLLDMMIDLLKVAMFDFSTIRLSIDEIIKESIDETIDDVKDLILNDRDTSNDDDYSEAIFDCFEVFSMK